MDFRVVQLDTAVSTNEEVKRAIEEGASEGLVVRARRQTGGYGRQGRTWESPEGGLYQSLLLRPQVSVAQLPTLSLVAALAVREAVLQTSGAPATSVQVKWPNDVLAVDFGGHTGGGRWAKLCGISCERHAGGVCVGIGVNVLRPSDAQAVASGIACAYWEDLAVTACGEAIPLLGDAILDTFALRYSFWQRDGFVAFSDEFASCSLLIGEYVRIVDLSGNVTAEGMATGVDAGGRLLVRTAAGEFPISSGEAHIEAIV